MIKTTMTTTITITIMINPHIEKFEGSTVLPDGYAKDGVELTGKDVNSGPCSEAADERVRQERRQEPQPHHTQEDLNTGKTA
jgi:hypothetical protein